ncbi:MAG: response regulator [Pseudomonadales bacterium]|nr:response regulator [Pseudomonadales bacterium]
MPIGPQVQIDLYDEIPEYDLNQRLRYFEDHPGTLTIDEVIKRDGSIPFKFNPEGPLSFGYTGAAIWVRLPMEYKGSFPKREYWLELDLPLLDVADVFVVDEQGNYQQFRSGYEVPISQRYIPNPSFVFPIKLEKHKPVVTYVRIKSDFTIHIPMTLWTEKGFSEHVALVELFYGIFLGSMAIMISYNFFVFWTVREKAYFFYVFYIVGYLLFTTTERVHGLQMFGDIPEMFHRRYLAIYIWLAWTGAFLMLRYFVNSPKNAPDMDRIIKVLAQASVLSLILSSMVDIVVAVQWAVVGTIFCTVVITWFGYSAMVRGFPGAQLYFVAWILNFGGVGVYGLAVTGNLPWNLLTANSPQFGVAFQLVLISFALADRIKVAQRMALDANQRAVSHLQRYRSLFDNAVEGIYQISLDRRFIDANPAMGELLGYSSSRDLILSTPDALSACYIDRSVRDSVVSHIQKGQEIIGLEAAYQTCVGEPRWGSTTLRIIYNKDGTPSHLEGSLIDITEEKERERVEKEREQERLHRQMAEASAAAKSQFLANMSHEIRTPLTAIIGYGESLLDDSMGADEKRRSAETVVRSGRHLLELINDILDHSKIDANKLEVEILPVSLLEMMAEIKSYFEPKANEKGLEFSIQYDFPVPANVQTDSTRIKQILINLCGNALKFTDRGSIRINIRCDREQEMIYFKVVDTGIGLKPEQMTRLFDAFAQASPSIAREYGGTGLGLNISKRLAEMLGGTIRVTSTYGQGSEFEVSLATGSLGDVQFIRDSSELTENQLNIRIARAPKLKGRILYAEDNEVNRRLVELLIRKTGAALTLVNNGAEALKAASEEDFDLILMDIQMPVMDGRDATEAIRKSGNSTPIIALTANIMAEDIREYKDAGCDDCLAKPIEKNRFYQTLERYLEVLPRDSEVSEGDDNPQFSGTVLVAEDNTDSQMLMEKYLKRVGVKAIIVENGKLAVQRALTDTVDLVLMDHHMPEMEGPDAIRMLRQTGFRRPILAFTASDCKDDLQEFHSAGCDGVLAKPVDRKALYDVLGNHLKKVTEQPKDDLLLEDAEFRAIVTEFIRNLPSRLDTIKQAFAESNWDEVRQVAHQIKGIAGSMGYPLITEKAKLLDMAIKNNESESYRKLMDDVISECEDAVEGYVDDDVPVSAQSQ